MVSGASFNNFTPANPKIVAGQTYNVLAFAGKDCTGTTLSASAFQPAADADVAARGLNCRQIVFIPGSGTVRWLNCS